jgi:hypothetical protein
VDTPAYRRSSGGGACVECPLRPDSSFAGVRGGALHPNDDHWYLPLTGVDPVAQGRDLGSALLRHALKTCDSDGLPACLEATSPRNPNLYARHGFNVVETIQAGTSPPLWASRVQASVAEFRGRTVAADDLRARRPGARRRSRRPRRVAGQTSHIRLARACRATRARRPPSSICVRSRSDADPLTHCSMLLGASGRERGLPRARRGGGLWQPSGAARGRRRRPIGKRPS